MRSATAALGTILALGTVSIVLYAQSSSALAASASNGGARIDAASLLVRSRRSAEARWLQQHGRPGAVSATDGASAELTAVAGDDALAQTGTPSLATPATATAAATPGTAQIMDREAAGCGPGPPRPYHTVLTSSSGGYQSWQCRIMYHHWKLQKSRDPCGEMGGFTRLLTNYRGVDDGGAFSNEIPTVVVKELSGGEARGYVVANRPYSMRQFVQHPAFKAIVEDYIYIAETDHVLLRPMPNLATADTPAAFNFGYMVAWGQANIVNKFVPGLGGKTDPVGPSPVIIHKKQLERMAEPWYDFTVKICSDAEAVQALGWVREMWGWAIAAGKLGIKHRVLDAFQYEGGSIGNRERRLAWPVAPAPVGPERSDMPYYIFHYTYGIEYSSEGLPMELQVGEWSLDKRHYMGGGPPRGLNAPPQCAHDRAHVLSGLFNNASDALAAPGGNGWTGRAGNTGHFNSLAMRGHDLRSHALAAKLLGTGPWALSGKSRSTWDGGRAYRLERLWILTNGWLVSGKGHGRWGLVADGAGGYVSDTVELSICNLKLKVKLTATQDGSWALESEGSIVAKLEADAATVALWSSPTAAKAPTDSLVARVEGSGPYRGQKAGAIMLLRAGVVHATGGRFNSYTRWQAHGDGVKITMSGGGSSPPLEVHFTDCWLMRFPAESTNAGMGSALKGMLGGGGAASADEGAPSRYGAGVAERSAEWIIQPAATLCEDVCAGLTLRRLTNEDRERSAAARSVENCCGFSWAGFGGLKFGPNGDLTTPWGRGVWGAPPEGQDRHSGKLLAEFAGHKHLLRVNLEPRGAGTVRIGRSMQSTRCADNDRSNVLLLQGTPRDAQVAS